ncbi:MAG: glycoside hydrolase family 2 TIM barrel-domain containing protein, partial [Chloroflexota bacterium]
MFHNSRILINDGWQFRFEGGSLVHVDLPHTWNRFDTMETDPDRHYRRGTGLYTRDLPALDKNRRWFIHVGAAAMRASLYQNRRLLTTHMGGYTPFEAELLHAGGQIRIEVDNLSDVDLIPSDRSDFFLYGGLTRNVWLYSTGRTRLVHLHLLPALRREHERGAYLADLKVSGLIDGEPDQGLELQLTIDDQAGEQLLTAVRPLADSRFDFDLSQIPNPRLWSPAEPNLYTVRAALIRQGEVEDQVIDRIGFRSFDFPAGGPFYLNGERLLLRGTHRHEDWAGLGSAVPDELSRQELAQIKAAGFNFVRLGHYPQAEAVLDACDALGLIVWEEIPWCRGGVGGERFKAGTQAMLEEMIHHHFNRPSILFWGIGNELDWESDHPQNSDDDVFAFLKVLHKMSHRLDPSRLTALRRYDRGANVVDVYSPSIWSGWYRGRYEDYEAVLKDAMTRFPRMIHTEWGGDSHVGRHGAGPHL